MWDLSQGTKSVLEGIHVILTAVAEQINKVLPGRWKGKLNDKY